MSESLRAADAAAAAVQKTPHRVTLDDLYAMVGAEYYTTLDRAYEGAPTHDALKTFTLCTIVTKSGFVINGTAAPADPGNFNAERGRKFAREDAIRQLWRLAGFGLCERLHEAAARDAEYKRYTGREDLNVEIRPKD